jgi:hydrogenase maturation protease
MGKATLPAGVLVIGYGNTLRQDDGVGPKTAEAIAALNLPGVTTTTCDLLTPEMAERISQAKTAFFIDASVEAALEVRLRKLEPNPTCQVMAHAADPRTMLALARDVFGHAPEGWWLTIPARRMGIGEDLSTVTRRGMKTAIQAVRARCGKARKGSRKHLGPGDVP